MRILFYGLLAVLALSFVSLGLGWWKLLAARPEANTRLRLAAICVSISDAWLLLALFIPRMMPSDSSRLWPVTIGGNFVVVGLVAVAAIIRRGAGKWSILCASVLSAIAWGAIYVIDSLIVV
jgi:hypothetical protein